MTAHVFFAGADAALAAVAGLFFLRNAVLTRDRFFALWTMGFWLLALNWVISATVAPTAEPRHVGFLVRLAAFLVIIASIIDKNRRPGR